MTTLAGTGALVRLALRRDRIILPIWIVLLTAVTVSTASAFAELYPTPESRQSIAAAFGGNPSLVAMFGPLFDSSLGALTVWRAGIAGGVLIPLMSLFTVTRHTRAEEEAGRLELVGAGVVGRNAPLTAALLVALAANLAFAVLLTLGLAGVGLPVSGALAHGLAWATAGVLFAAIAAVAAQVTESARAANGIATSVLGLSFLLRAIGDTSGASWLSWLSPIGWIQQIRPYADERWWVFGLASAFVTVLVGAAYVLDARRDLGAGLVPPRPGPAVAAPGLRSPLALAWRLHRGVLLGWTAGLAVLGAGVGSVAQGVGDILQETPQLEEIFARLGGQQVIVDAYLAATMGFVGLIASAYAVQATLRLRSEENGLRAEPVLATGVGRLRWATSHLVFAAFGTGVLLTVAGLAAGLTHGLVTGDVGTQLPRVLGGALVQLPAAWVLAGVAVALFGLVPRLAVASWAALVLVLLIGQFGPILQLDQWVLDLSPFAHVPQLPGGELTMAPLVALAPVAGALVVAGLAGFRRRDLIGGAG
jgi:ABC-2 type transport system permease protein